MKAKLIVNNQELDVDISQEELEKIQPKIESKRWKPEKDELYWFVSNHGEVISVNWHNVDFDKWQYYARNCFKTSEEADKHLEYLNAKAAILDHADEVNEGWEYSPGSTGCEVFWDNSLSGLSVNNLDSNVYAVLVVHKSQAASQDSIEKLEKEWKIVLGVEG